jgi:glycine cleavage system H protein
VSELYAPVTGTVVARNEALDAAPDQVNSEPYGAGWLIDIQVPDPAAVDALLSAADYEALTAG